MNQTIALKALKQYFGYAAFRPMQAEIIQSIYNKNDCLVLMPTGGGKSICFQIPGITLPGLTLVVSPLISLMKDQVDGLQANGIAAAYLNSTIPQRQQRSIENSILEGAIKLLYVSPERIANQGFNSFLQRLSISLIAIDEAHCISSWGHDFRPEYTKLKQLKVQFPNTPIVALTATADRITRTDITEQLQLNHPKVFLASFDRPNLSLNVTAGKNKFRKIVQLIDRHPEDAGIVYCLSRKETERIANRLVTMGISAGAYHAGLSTKIRNQVQEAFINDRVAVICATVAFGMGIDKSNIRWIIHHNLPKNIEAFYQQIGRAGRDGLPSETLLLYSPVDLGILRKFVNESGQSNLMEEKLKRMQQYAESVTCRRKLLLSYFNEQLTTDCGNCDVCLNPPKRIDGTELAQQILSIILQEKEHANEERIVRQLLRRSIELSWQGWAKLIVQLLNHGLLEIAYNHQGQLKVTDYGKTVLDGSATIYLVPPAQMRIPQLIKPNTKQHYKKPVNQNNLFRSLKRFRKSIARQQGIPPYLIFDDAVLDHLASQKPPTLEEMATIPGIGAKKLEQFGELFLNKIKDYDKFDQENPPSINSGNTDLAQDVLSAFRKGQTIAEITRQLNTEEDEVHNILLTHLQQGTSLDFKRLISQPLLNRIEYVVRVTGNQGNLKELYDDLNQEIPMHIIRYGLAVLEKRKAVS